MWRLPDAWPNGTVTGLRARGGYQVDISWANGTLIKAAIRNDTADGECYVRYGKKSVTLMIAEGQAKELTPASFR